MKLGLVCLLFWLKHSALIAENISLLPQPEKKVYNIGGWMIGTPSLLSKYWEPLFETYLTEQVGTLYNPSITFKLLPVDFFPNATSVDLIKLGLVDFIYTLPGGITCLQASQDFIPLLTQRHIILGKEASGYGSLIFSLKSNAEIQRLSDLKNKRVGVGQPLASGGYQLGWKYLNDNGINILTDSSQIVFYQSDYERMLNDVLTGTIDFGMTMSSWLESNAPDKVPLLRFHDLRQPSLAGEPYPFLTTTDLVPTFGFAASPTVPRRLLLQVFAALKALNASHPAARAAGIAGFTIAASYEPLRVLAEQLQIMRVDPAGGKSCLDMFAGIYPLVSCPPRFYKRGAAGFFTRCGALGTPCPAGLACVCQPCLPDEASTLGSLSVLASCLIVVFLMTSS